MNMRFWLKRATCVALVIVLLLAFCAMGHDCHHEDCPVCTLAASFRLTLGLTALAIGLFCLRCWHFPEDAQRDAAGRGVTLVALKIKLSN
jgi:hypothetical protein